MKEQERNDISTTYFLFCLSDVSLQRYDTSKFEKNEFFTKSAAVHNFYIAWLLVGGGGRTSICGMAKD
jgi:hypothetical protein